MTKALTDLTSDAFVLTESERIELEEQMNDPTLCQKGCSDCYHCACDGAFHKLSQCKLPADCDCQHPPRCSCDSCLTAEANQDERDIAVIERCEIQRLEEMVSS